MIFNIFITDELITHTETGMIHNITNNKRVHQQYKENIPAH